MLALQWHSSASAVLTLHYDRYCESTNSHFSLVIVVFSNCQSFWTFIDPMVSDEVKMQLMALRDAESDIMKCRVSPSLPPPPPLPLSPSLYPPSPPPSPRITNSPPPPSRPVMAEDHTVQISSDTISRRPSKTPGTSSVSHIM